MNTVGLKILAWHKEIDRDLPWKNTDDPYFIWLSEIILQQTRVQQGLPYYLKFVETFPTVHQLADASEEQVFKVWEGLGYYSRARNLHATAQYISRELHGRFPNNYDDLLKLRGVGPYTAAAISSFAFNEDRAVLDGNVFRVLSRIYDVDEDILSSTGKKQFGILATETLIKGKAALYNQAIMDFGALQCVPSNPSCMFCPMLENCASYAAGTVAFRPVKKKAKAKKTRYFHFLIVTSKTSKTKDSTLLVERREHDDIWKGLYQFPLIETEGPEAPTLLLWEEKLTLDLSNWQSSELQYKQTLSHQNIIAYFHRAEMLTASQDNPVEESSEDYEFTKTSIPYISTSIEQLGEYSYPKIIRSFIEEELSE